MTASHFIMLLISTGWSGGQDSGTTTLVSPESPARASHVLAAWLICSQPWGCQITGEQSLRDGAWDGASYGAWGLRGTLPGVRVRKPRAGGWEEAGKAQPLKLQSGRFSLYKLDHLILAFSVSLVFPPSPIPPFGKDNTFQNMANVLGSTEIRCCPFHKMGRAKRQKWLYAQCIFKKALSFYSFAP